MKRFLVIALVPPRAAVGPSHAPEAAHAPRSALLDFRAAVRTMNGPMARERRKR